MVSETDKMLAAVDNNRFNIPGYPNTYIEPGYHFLREDSKWSNWLKFKAELDSGGKTRHIWNKEILQRISTYQPKILTIDGIDPTQVGFGDWSDISVNLPLLWYVLPGRPKEINDQGIVQVVKADLTHNLYSGLFLDPQIREFLVSIYGQLETKSNLMLGGVFGEYTLTAILGHALYRWSRMIQKENQGDIERENWWKRQLTRREFLKYMGTAIILTAIRPVSGFLAAKTGNELTKDILSRFADLARTRMVKLDLVNFRTSLMIQKTLDVLDQGRNLNIDPSDHTSFIFGFAHLYEAFQLFTNTLYRKHLIKENAEEILNLIRNSVHDQLTPQSLEFVLEEVRKQIARVEVVQIIDPGDDDSQFSFKERLQQNVSLKADFISPRVWSEIYRL